MMHQERSVRIGRKGGYGAASRTVVPTRSSSPPIYVDEPVYSTVTRSNARGSRGPIIVEEPRPIIVDEPRSIYVEDRPPLIVEDRPIIVEEPRPIIVPEYRRSTSPVYIEKPVPEPIFIEEEPLYIDYQGEVDELRLQVRRLQERKDDLMMANARRGNDSLEIGELRKKVEAARNKNEKNRADRSREKSTWDSEYKREIALLEERIRTLGHKPQKGSMGSLVALQHRLIQSKDDEIRQLAQLAVAHKEQITLLHCGLRDGLPEVDEILQLDKNRSIHYLTTEDSVETAAHDHTAPFKRLDERLGTQTRTQSLPIFDQINAMYERPTRSSSAGRIAGSDRDTNRLDRVRDMRKKLTNGTDRRKGHSTTNTSGKAWK